MHNIIEFKNDNNYERHSKYQEQYRMAIKILLNENMTDVFLPVINLILQSIENDLKSFIIEYDLYPDSAKDLEIKHHNIGKLVEDELFVEKFKNHVDFQKYYNLYKEEVLYFYNIIGMNSFLNSRYPLKSDVQTVSIDNKEIDVGTISYHWQKYLENLLNINFVFSVNYLHESIKVESRLKKIDVKKVLFDFVRDNFRTKECVSDNNLSYNLIKNIIIEKNDKKLVKYIIELLEISS